MVCPIPYGDHNQLSVSMPALYVKLRPLGCARYQNRLRCARVKSTQKITVHQQYHSSTDDACPELFYTSYGEHHRKNHAFPRDYRTYRSRTRGISRSRSRQKLRSTLVASGTHSTLMLRSVYYARRAVCRRRAANVQGSQATSSRYVRDSHTSIVPRQNTAFTSIPPSRTTGKRLSANQRPLKLH